MSRSYPSIFRSQARTRRRRLVMVPVLGGIAACAIAYALTGQPTMTAPGAPAATAAAPAMLALTTMPPAAAKPAVRRIYPYSVVPGGVASQAELVRIVRNDKVVAAHYAGFQVDQARPVTVKQARAVHVSYRKGDKVYWTAKKVMLREGETLLSDGENEMRARCANRISDVARFPVEADADAPGELLDAAFEETLEAPGDAGLYGALLLGEAPALGEADSRGMPSGTAGARQSAAGSVQFAGAPAFPADAMRLATLRQLAAFDGGSVLAPVRGTAPPVLAAETPDIENFIPSLPVPPLFVGIPVDTSDLDPFLPKPGPDGSPPAPEASRDTPPAEVPEPNSAWLVLAALLALVLLRK